jgi:hypothetical protein
MKAASFQGSILLPQLGAQPTQGRAVLPAVVLAVVGRAPDQAQTGPHVTG